VGNPDAAATTMMDGIAEQSGCSNLDLASAPSPSCSATSPLAPRARSNGVASVDGDSKRVGIRDSANVGRSDSSPTYDRSKQLTYDQLPSRLASRFSTGGDDTDGGDCDEFFAVADACSDASSFLGIQMSAASASPRNSRIAHPGTCDGVLRRSFLTCFGAVRFFGPWHTNRIISGRLPALLKLS
jgi:hypothetical protein